MTTPTKEQIVQRAIEMFHQDSFGVTEGINPTLQELNEGGYLARAQHDLMRSEDYQYKMYIEQTRCKSYLKPNMLKGKLPLDFAECQKSNILISGTNQQGKSLCAMGISDLLMRRNWQILAFDNVGHWKEKSSISKCFTVKKKKDRFSMRIGESVIFDISLLLPKDQKKLVEQILEQTWQFRVLQKPTKWLMIAFEEFQLYSRYVRGNDAQNILRIMSVGANHKIRCLGITPDLSLIDCAFIRLAQQRYHFRLGNEPNAKRRFRAYYGSDWGRIAQGLDVGFSVYVNKDKLETWKIPLFENGKIKVSVKQ